VGGVFDCNTDGSFIVKGNRVAAAHPPRSGDVPAAFTKAVGEARGGVPHSKYEHVTVHRHGFAI